MKLLSKKGMSLTGIMIAAVVATLVSILAASLMKSVFSQGSVAEAKGVAVTETEIVRNLAASTQMLAAVQANNLLMLNATKKAQLGACLQGKGVNCNTGSWTAEVPLSLPATPQVNQAMNKQASFHQTAAACGANCDYGVTSTMRYVCPDATSCSSLTLKTTLSALKSEYKSTIKPMVSEISIPARRLTNTETLALQCANPQEMPVGFDSVTKKTICKIPTNPCSSNSGALCMKVRDPSVANNDANGNGNSTDDGAPATPFAINSVSLNQFTAAAEPTKPTPFYSVYSEVVQQDGCTMSCNDGNKINRTDKTCSYFVKKDGGDQKLGQRIKSTAAAAVPGETAALKCDNMAVNPSYAATNLGGCGGGNCYKWNETGCTKTCGGGKKTYDCVGKNGEFAYTISANGSSVIKSSIKNLVFANNKCGSKPDVDCNTQSCCEDTETYVMLRGGQEKTWTLTCANNCQVRSSKIVGTTPRGFYSTVSSYNSAVSAAGQGAGGWVCYKYDEGTTSVLKCKNPDYPSDTGDGKFKVSCE
ncbi:MAG: hypothetical protein ABIR96_01530 [Bdellovibrionota bacterium]